MKYRKSFVTNSSSSSFIVASKVKCETLPVTISFNYDLMKSVHTTFSDMKKFKKEFEEMYGTSEDWTDYNCREFAKCVSILLDGGYIYMGSVGNDYDKPIEQLLYQSGFENVQPQWHGEIISSES